MRRVRICAPNILAMSKENVDFAHPIFGPYFMYCAPNLRLLPPPLRDVISYSKEVPVLQQKKSVKLLSSKEDKLFGFLYGT